jgi:hypothetical protein
MALTTTGINHIANSIVGQATAFNAANARLGVGNGTAAFAASQNDLQGTSKLRKAMDSGYPSVYAPVVTFKSTFKPDEANFAWNEWGIFNAATGGVMLNRVVESNGTKQSNQTWVLEVAITFAIGN